MITSISAVQLEALRYELLAKVFREEASEAFLKELEELDFNKFFPISEFGIEVSQIEERIRTAIATQKDNPRTLRLEFAKLFLGPIEIIAPQWSSVYLDSKNSSMGLTTLRVRDVYAMHGVEISKRNVEPDDHLAYELSFVAHLLTKASLSANKEEESRLLSEASTFINSFMKPWVSKFVTRVKTAKVSEFYPSFAQLLEMTIYKNQ